MHEPVRRGLGLFAAAVLLGAAARAGAAPAAEPADGLIGGASTCPSPAAVRTEVETLVPRDRLNAKLRAIGGSTAPVEIIDVGVPFKVIAAGSVREYRDEARNCAYRARVAAVFVALVIDPAAILTAPPATPVAAPPPPPPPPAPPPPAPIVVTHPRARLDLGAAAEAGLGSNTRVGEMGLGLRLAVGSGRIALALGAAGLAPVETTVGGVRLRQWRLPVDLGVRARGQLRLGGRPVLDPYAELAASAAVLSESALDLATRQTRTSLELGLRGAVGLHLATSSRVTPFLTLHAVLVPRPPTIFALPQGAVGHTPTFWIGATAGLSWGFF